DGEAQRLDAAVATLKAELDQCVARIGKLFEGDVEKEFAQEDRARVVKLAARTRTAMQEFLRRATERKIDRLSGLITESFRFLLRKKSMVERIMIDPATLASPCTIAREALSRRSACRKARSRSSRSRFSGAWLAHRAAPCPR